MSVLAPLTCCSALLAGLGLLSTTLPSRPDRCTSWVQAAEYPTLGRALAAARGRTLVISSPVVLEADTVGPPNRHLLFCAGGCVRQSKHFTLFIRGPLTAPALPIFAGFAPGEIRLGAGVVDGALPQWWGAKANGQMDDTLPLQCALDSGCPLIRLPKGRYLLRAPLNLSHRAGLTVAGAGSAEGLTTALIGDTGGVVLDLSGSRHVELRDFDILSGDTKPSTVGILYARTERVQYVEFNSLTNVGVFLRSLPQANNGHGTVAVYNYAAELWRGRNLYLVADTAIVFTGYNAYGLRSPFVDLFAGYPSMSQCTVDGVSTLRGLAGPCVLCDNGTGIEVLNAYFCGGAVGPGPAHGPPPAPFPYAVKVTGPGFFTHRLTITGHLERAGGWLYADVNVTDLRLAGTGSPSGPAVHLEPPSGALVGGELTVRPLTQPYEMVLLDAPGPGTVTNVTVHLLAGQKILAPAVKFSGNIIQTPLSRAEARAAVAVAPSASYLLLAGDGAFLVNEPAAP
jgi:hypothetical protein